LKEKRDSFATRETRKTTNEDFEHPSDEDHHGNVLLIRNMDIDREDDIKKTRNKEDANSAVEAEEQTPPSPERQERRLIKHGNDIKKMKK
jgi:hypothetical protein